ncbi:hypothetical protein HanOQP8_Chr10g0358191 [Helianthus annuus]|nr:hypothetical protein HanOQP8_Chr10g0358191 [Helianthus annuus]
MAHGRHTGSIVGFNAASKGEAIETLAPFKLDSLTEFIGVVKEMEVMSFLFVDALSRMVDHPILELEAMEPQGLNKNLYEQVFVVSSTKWALFETNDEEVGYVGTSSKKPKISEEPEKVSSMSIPIDVTPLSSVSVETTPLSTKTKALMMTWMICMMTFLGRLLLLMMKLQVVKVFGVQALVEVFDVLLETCMCLFYEIKARCCSHIAITMLRKEPMQLPYPISFLVHNLFFLCGILCTSFWFPASSLLSRIGLD